LGEYAALHIAGVISASDAIFLTGTRATMLVQRCSMGTHAMLAVKSSLANVTPHLAGTECEIACINGANEVVISGRIVEIDALSATLTPVGLKCVKLEVPFAFHSAQVEPILEEFETAAHGAVFNKPAIPFLSPFFGGVVKEEKILGPSYLSHACRKTVNFLSGLEAAKTAAVISDKTVWVEIGSHPVCSGMIKAAFGPQTTAVPSLRRNSDTWKVIVDSVSTLHREGIEIRWNEYHRDFEACHEVLKLPTYQWDSKNHWIQYSNNFCLTKGDTPAPVTAAPASANLSTTSVQRVIDRSIGSEKSTVLAESDLSDPLLSQVVQSHMVNGTALCPSVSPVMSPIL
jgi:naphtho-gamma-pyrone polyketide synthase